ncbi:NADPH oxidase 4 [Beauveria brongniartii RCEF 3172]|uniref:NADPH oxidase 4 n=1 Tax=Beauveria brongniartii RCEF 3172 TaxID=1081107 RepID=A0A167BCM2_9HYPO|nr:NADPH oxidase 4 [Beauveria brongniartii RCEF 3172]
MFKNVVYLSDDEINEFVDLLDINAAGGDIYRSELEQCLEQTRIELARPANSTCSDENARVRREAFRDMLGATGPVISRDYLVARIRAWRIPSLVQAKKQEKRQDGDFQRRGALRLFRAYWAVHGYEIIFLSFVVATIAASATAEIVRYDASRYTSAFGYGVVVAKGCTGALYPTFFFMTLSMSRYFATMLRRSSYAMRFLNLDLSRQFHIYISSFGLVLATIHAGSHLIGTFSQGSDPKNEEAVTRVIAKKVPGRHYIDYVRSRAGVTGLAALSLFYMVAILSVPPIRRWHYNLFQLGHLLLYPIIALMMAHGTSQLLQAPVFGYVLALPTFLLLFERISRVCLGLYLIDASIEVLTSDTIEMTVEMPDYRIWDYTAGQYILLLVPGISLFQWHPFTISYCHDKTIKLHIKTDGDWTAKLRNLDPSIKVAINGPFGAPAQRFGDFRYSVIIGAGVGITPFSAILADLQRKDDLAHGWHRQQLDRGHGPCVHETVPPSLVQSSYRVLRKHRRTDFHWIVRDRHSLSWLSDLLNHVSMSQQRRRGQQDASQLDIRINTHITAKHASIVAYIFSWILETSRSDHQPASSLTGLLNATSFGRPDFDSILDEHYYDMKMNASRDVPHRRYLHNDTSQGHEQERSVGVFYCGASEVGVRLADKCWQLTARGRNDGTHIKYHFIVEAF